MKKIFLFLFLLAVLAAQLAWLPGRSNPQPAFARPLLQGSGSDVIALVNALRVANGLPPFKLNSDLMASAQAHSEYQAANQDTMRTGVDGSTAKDTRHLGWLWRRGDSICLRKHCQWGKHKS